VEEECGRPTGARSASLPRVSRTLYSIEGNFKPGSFLDVVGGGFDLAGACLRWLAAD
jgi:hypothetical protein